ncbi:MAG: multidrug transporter [Ilumatobacteraceae bacterium]|nr:multidrug transporter [Ilumatobacteraceae bacterium]
MAHDCSVSDSIRRASTVVLFAGLLCGTTGTALSRLAPQASPLSAGAMRLLVGGVALAAVALVDGRRPSELAGHRTSLAVGAVAVALYQVCFFTGTTRTGVALATVTALGSAPVFSGLIDAIVLRRPPSLRWLAGTVAAVLGVALIAGGQPAARTDVGGIFAALGAGLAWAVYAMIGRQRIAAGLSSTTCMAAMFVGGAVLSAPLLAVGTTNWIVTPKGVALALYLGIVTVGVVYTCLGWGLRTLSAPTVVTVTLAEPITAALLATVVLDQVIGVSGALGIATVSAALVITARDRRSIPSEPAQSRRRGPPFMPGQRELPIVSVCGQNASGSSAPARVSERVE